MRSPTLARAAVIAILAVSGVVGAFATIAPGPDGQALPPTTALVETLSIRANDALLPSPASYFREEPFQRGDTLASFLSRSVSKRRRSRAWYGCACCRRCVPALW